MRTRYITIVAAQLDPSANVISGVPGAGAETLVGGPGKDIISGRAVEIVVLGAAGEANPGPARRPPCPRPRRP